jgi:hypothetical protein
VQVRAVPPFLAPARARVVDHDDLDASDRYILDLDQLRPVERFGHDVDELPLDAAVQQIGEPAVAEPDLT